jgi:putative aldouronate transport system permease protein
MSQYTSAPTIRPDVIRRATHSSGSISDRMYRLARAMWKYRWIYLIMTPTLLYFLVFKYVPLYNAQIAFKDFQPVLGIEDSPWVGLQNLEGFLNSIYFGQLMTNTIFFSGARLVFGIPLAIVLALMLHETRFAFFRNLVQTVTYLPHFLSWVVMFGILLMLLSPGDGLVNEIIKSFGGSPIPFLTTPSWFRQVVIGSDIWKETGWSTILYLAALLSISPELYEAAAVDGASRLQRIWNISLPGIIPVVVLVTLLRLGNILEGGFTQLFVLYSLPVYSVGDIIDTWVYRSGILDFQLSLATAVGLFKGVIGLTLIMFSNQIAKRIAGRNLY